MKNFELITTTNSIPNSLKPMSRIENGTHAMLGNDNSPAEKEFNVLPNPLNFTITNPTAVPKVSDIAKAASNLPRVTPMFHGKEPFRIIFAKVSATIIGEGKISLEIFQV